MSQDRQYRGPVLFGSRLSSGGGVSSRSCFTFPATVNGEGGGWEGFVGCGLLFLTSDFPFTCVSAGISSGVTAGGGSGVGAVVSSSKTHVM